MTRWSSLINKPKEPSPKTKKYNKGNTMVGEKNSNFFVPIFIIPDTKGETQSIPNKIMKSFAKKGQSLRIDSIIDDVPIIQKGVKIPTTMPIAVRIILFFISVQTYSIAVFLNLK
jgi:hypothetical protein